MSLAVFSCLVHRGMKRRSFSRTPVVLSLFVCVSLVYYALSFFNGASRSAEFSLLAEPRVEQRQVIRSTPLEHGLHFAGDRKLSGAERESTFGTGAGETRNVLPVRVEVSVKQSVSTKNDVETSETPSKPNVSNTEFGESLIRDQRNVLKSFEDEYKGRWMFRNLVPELGGTPVRNMILTTWRSGSTFLGDLVTSHPGTFYHYEPLLHFGINRIRTFKRVDGDAYNGRKAVDTLWDLMNCSYANLTDYLSYGLTHPYLMSHNEPVWSKCRRIFNVSGVLPSPGGPGTAVVLPKTTSVNGAEVTRGSAEDRVYQWQDWSVCFNAEFLRRYCQLFPIQAIKTVRVGLAAIEPLLTDPTLNLKVLLLIRDPRGTMESRKHRDWCPGNPDCDDPAHLCSDMVADYHAARHLSAKFPGKIRVERYEDVSTTLEKSVPSIFKFFRLSLTAETILFLESHTKVNLGGVSSTYRDSKRAPFEWRFKLTEEEAKAVEGSCTEAMDLWGYRKLAVAEWTKEELEKFDPLVREFELKF